MVEMAAPTWARAKARSRARARAKARARARAGPHPACVRANIHVGAAPFYRTARFLGIAALSQIPKKRGTYPLTLW